MTAWFTNKNKQEESSEKYNNLKIRARILEDGMNYTQLELK